ncbi:MAG: alkaline phosphatase family protein [Acidobacteriia bacterium]|nr:alkaline phosphatase family protein [Terriglobia bacterium]
MSRTRNNTVAGKRRLPRWLGCAALTLLLLLVLPSAAHAYVGPGAGFAVLSSFLTLLLASVQAFFALLTWPVRQIFRARRRRRAYRRARTDRVVILGFDGMDPELTERYIREGKLPNLAKLREKGTFRPLATTIPPISPVAWSSFLTGVNPGKHNIYDFLAPDRQRYLPELSSARIRESKRVLRIGRYAIPLGKPSIKPLRRGKPFWHYLGDAGVFCSVIRVPITFPPEKFSGVLLSGMCVPDIQGTQGTFSYHTTRRADRETTSNRVVVPLVKNGKAFHSYIPGPLDTLRTDAKEELRAHFAVKPLAGKRKAQLQMDGKKIELAEGEYSEWAEVEFSAGLGVTVKGICRFYLKSVQPELELYATPVNINPMNPALPISHSISNARCRSGAFLRMSMGNLGAERRISGRQGVSGAVLPDSRGTRAHVLRRAGKDAAGRVRMRLRHHRPRAAHVLALPEGWRGQRRRACAQPRLCAGGRGRGGRGVGVGDRKAVPAHGRVDRADGGEDGKGFAAADRLRPRIQVVRARREPEHLAAPERLPGVEGGRAFRRLV